MGILLYVLYSWGTWNQRRGKIWGEEFANLQDFIDNKGVLSAHEKKRTGSEKCCQEDLTNQIRRELRLPIPGTEKILLLKTPIGLGILPIVPMVSAAFIDNRRAAKRSISLHQGPRTISSIGNWSLGDLVSVPWSVPGAADARVRVRLFWVVLLSWFRHEHSGTTVAVRHGRTGRSGNGRFRQQGGQVCDSESRHTAKRKAEQRCHGLPPRAGRFLEVYLPAGGDTGEYRIPGREQGQTGVRGVGFRGFFRTCGHGWRFRLQPARTIPVKWFVGSRKMGFTAQSISAWWSSWVVRLRSWQDIPPRRTERALGSGAGGTGVGLVGIF